MEPNTLKTIYKYKKKKKKLWHSHTTELVLMSQIFSRLNSSAITRNTITRITTTIV